LKALVTGGAGFIGSHVVDRLIKSNVETYILVSGFRSTKHPSIVNPEARVIKGDLRNYNDLEAATKNKDVVFHLGGVFSHYFEAYPDLTIDVNISGTWNLKKACITNKVNRIIFASSSLVYGEPSRVPIDEEHPLNPKDLLGITKLASEKILQASYPYKIDYTILRLFNVYGPRQYPDELYSSVFSTWIKQALQGKSLEIHDKGKQRLDFVYVEDVADSFIASLRVPALNQIFNVGSGISITLNTLAHSINIVTRNYVKPHYNLGHPAFLKWVQADIRKITSCLQWQPSTSLVCGLEKTVNFFKGAQT